jgi:hypothetical protein
MSSRVWFPALNTASTLLKVSVPSGVNGLAGGAATRGACASACMSILPPGKRPPVSVISPAFAPPTKKPSLNASRMLRLLYRSSRT